MATMTYKQLAEAISAMTPEQQNQTATIYVPGVDEYFPAQMEMPDTGGVLDDNHYVLSPEGVGL